jgi:hypothetical protein
MSLSKTQQEFTECVAKLITYAYQHGYKLTFGDAYRDPRVHGDFGEKKSYASKHSVHKVRLAVDLNLFVDGEYITSGDHAAYQQLGYYWKTLHPFAVWGGVFNDANHFSFEYKGFK